MTTIEAVIFGMMLSWTPCVLLMAYLLWRAPLEAGLGQQLQRNPSDEPQPAEGSHRDRQQINDVHEPEPAR